MPSPYGAYSRVKRLQEIVRLHSDASVSAIGEAIFVSVATFTAGQEQYDDITVVILKAGDGT